MRLLGSKPSLLSIHIGFSSRPLRVECQKLKYFKIIKLVFVFRFHSWANSRPSLSFILATFRRLRSAFRTLSNICDGAFLQKKFGLKPLTIFERNLRHKCWHYAKYVSYINNSWNRPSEFFKNKRRGVN